MRLRSRARIDPATTFRLASVTKQFTAMAVMMLVRDGNLRYEDALTDLDLRSIAPEVAAPLLAGHPTP